MKVTFVKEYWEQGSRPGRMKCNLTRQTTVREVSSIEEAMEIMQKIFKHCCDISYDQVRFHSIHLFEGDVEEEFNPFCGRKYWTLENTEIARWFSKWTLSSERPGYWANLRPDQQQVVAMIDSVSTALADSAAREFQRCNLPR